MAEQKSNKVKLTKRVVDAATPDASKRVFLWDTEIIGFCLRVYPTGLKTYYLQYRNQNNITRKIKIGSHGNMTTEQARDKARRLSLEVGDGKDPSAEQKQVKQKPTFQYLAEQYLEIYAKENKRASSYEDDESMLNRILLSRFGPRKIEEITSHDLQTLQHELRDTPYAANRVRALLSKMFNLAKQWGWLSSNPVEAVSKYQEQKRERWLDEDEMGRLWAALDKHSYHRTSFVYKLLLLTGARKGELLNSTWDQFDLEKGVWSKPSHLTKQKKNERLPLSSKALDVLLELKEKHPSTSKFLFPGKVDGRPMIEVKTFWKTILKEAEIENFRVHDLRHTHASHLVSSGLSLSIVGKLLGHTQASTTQRYAHLADEPLREAAELFGNMVGRKK